MSLFYDPRKVEIIIGTGPRYGVRDALTGKWLAHYTASHKWQIQREGRAVFTVRERAIDVRDCWRWRGYDAHVVRLRPLPLFRGAPKGCVSARFG